MQSRVKILDTSSCSHLFLSPIILIFNTAKTMQLNSSTARTARTAGAILYGCTCGLKAGYASPSLIHQNRVKRWSSSSNSASTSAGPSTEIYDNSNDNTAEDYHDPAHARMLTSRLTKTKKRMVKRVCRKPSGRIYLIHMLISFFLQGQDFVDKLTIQVKAGKRVYRIDDFDASD